MDCTKAATSPKAHPILMMTREAGILELSAHIAVKKFRVSSGSLDWPKSHEQFLYIGLGMEGLCAFGQFQGLSESLRLLTSSLLCCLQTFL